jgi:cell wall-associated protease
MKKIIVFMLSAVAGNMLLAQDQPAQDWYQQPNSKKNMGIHLYQAYDQLLKDKKAKDIVVAVIDGGTDITHPDLVGSIWHNPGEIPFNNVDDDNNGYVDDTVGWNFIGGANGAMVEFDNLEKTRILRKLSGQFGDVDAEDIGGNPARVAQYELYQRLKSEITGEQKVYANYFEQFEKAMMHLKKMKELNASGNPSMAEIEKYTPSNGTGESVKESVLSQMKSGSTFESIYSQNKSAYDQLNAFANYHYDTKYDPRYIVADDYGNSYQKGYGNNNVAGPDPSHGTHVAGIIAATRNNGIGMNGIADHVRIMVIRVVPNGDERDKDVANGIRYAVDNGAKIINMSFGKGYSWDKKCVDSAVAYAVSKGVLLIHAAGNDAENNDFEPNYPNDSLRNSRFAETWVEVGASAPPKKKLAATFSNYGAGNVDVFAPGYQIYSTTPDNHYEFYDGTSMAAPVTSGVAALVWSYYPQLTALQVKEILMKSAIVNKKKVPLPGARKKVKFNSLSVSGGVVNAYKALELAAQMTATK